MPAKDANAISVEIIMDKYLENSVKGCTRKKHGDQSTRVHITGLAQKIPTVNRWRELLHNNENKTNLIEMFVKYLKTSAVRQNISVPLIVTCYMAYWHG